MTISPWAMLMTPITPNVIARPIAASSNTEPSETPCQAFCAASHKASCCRIAVAAAVAARRMFGGASGGTAMSTARESDPRGCSG